jgi:hypothetical protein
MITHLTVLLANIAVSTCMVVLTVILHFLGLMGLTRLMNRTHHRLGHSESLFRQAALLVLVVLGIFLLHTIEIWIYALLYLELHELASFETALYYSTVTFVSLGYGDVVLSRNWRLLGAIEGANGVIMFAWSTAFLLSVTTRLRALEHTWHDS